MTNEQTTDSWNESETGLITAADERKLTLATINGFAHSGEPVGQDDLDRFMAWAASIQSGQILINLVLSGQVVPTGWGDDEPAFGPTDQVLNEDQLQTYVASRETLEAAERQRLVSDGAVDDGDE